MHSKMQHNKSATFFNGHVCYKFMNENIKQMFYLGEKSQGKTYSQFMIHLWTQKLDQPQ